MRYKILFCLFLTVLVIASLVSAKPIDDMTPPIISNVQPIQLCFVGGDCGSIFILWDTDEPSYLNTVKYGNGKQYQYSFSVQPIYSGYAPSTHIAFPLTLVKPGNYHYRVGSCDLFGNCAYSEDHKIKIDRDYQLKIKTRGKTK